MANKKKRGNNRNHNNRQQQGGNRNVNGHVQRSKRSDSTSSSIECNRSVMSVKDDIFGDTDKRINLNYDQHEEKNGVVNSEKNVSVKEKDLEMGMCRPKGLHNLGNTCYFNSVMQVISQTHLLYQLLNSRSNEGFEWIAKGLQQQNEWTFKRQWDEELPVLLSHNYQLADSLIKFMREMRSTHAAQTVKPAGLLKEIRKKWSQFVGCSQEDSHELLRCLLDSLRCDEIRRQRRGIMRALNISDGSQSNLDDDTKARCKSFTAYSYGTIIDSTFGGIILSSITCQECNNISQRFEPFFDLSLPINEERSKPPTKKGGQSCKSNADVQPTQEQKNLIDEDSKTLTPKERRNKRQQKKAAKREARQQRKSESGDKHDEEADDALQNNGDDGEEKILDADDPDSESKQIANEIAILVNQLVTSVVEQEEKLTSENESAENNKLENDKENENSRDADGEDDGSEDEDIKSVFPLESTKHLNIGGLTSNLESLSISDGDKVSLVSSEFISEKRKMIIRKSLVPLTRRTDNRTESTSSSSSAQTSGKTSLHTCLYNFTSAELMIGKNKICCEVCTKQNENTKTYTNASLQVMIAIPPPILTLHLKRFEAEGYRSCHFRKINSAVSFPAILDLSPFTSQIYNQLTPLTKLNKTKAIKYSLYGVVQHGGTLRSGHYTCFVKARKENAKVSTFAMMEPFLPKVDQVLNMIEELEFENATNSAASLHDIEENGMNGNGHVSDSEGEEVEESGKWYHISDSSVSPVTLNAVLHSQAYILFYERIC